MQFIYPTLLEALFSCQRIDFSRYRHHARDIASLRLSTRHAAEASCYEQHAFSFFYRTLKTAFAKLLTSGIHHRDGGAVYDALRTDIHIAAGGHLAVLAHAEGVEALPMILTRIVGDNHTIGHHYARRIFMAREESHRQARIHSKRLLVGHRSQILHRQAVLRPVLEDSTISAIYNQLVRMLRHTRVEVVLNHRHDSRSLTALSGILIDWTSIHIVARTETIHIDSAIGAELLCKLRSERCMELLREIA